MNIGIIGLGLIGGSLGRAIIKKTEHKVYGSDISPEAMLKAQMLSAVHFPLTDGDYKKLDLLIIAVCPRAFVKIMREQAPKLKKGACVLDIGGNKKLPVSAMRKLSEEYPHLKFIATHPMAGKEFSGINHSSPLLFEKASVIIVPIVSDIETTANAKKLFLDLGFSNIVFSDENTHDKIIAYTSQLAHIISSCYVQSDSAENHDGFSAGSFRDLSRVAKMNPDMWAELIIDNKDGVLPELEALIDRLNSFKNALRQNDETKIKTIFEKGNLKKEQIEKNTREWKKSNENN